jgi:hypothetical protein
MSQTVTAYADYLCPYTWRGSELAAMVAGPLGLRFDWRPFSVIQAGRRAGDTWQVWNMAIDDNDAHGSNGLQPFLAACAARRQDPAAFERFHLGLLRGAPPGGGTHDAGDEPARGRGGRPAPGALRA